MRFIDEVTALVSLRPLDRSTKSSTSPRSEFSITVLPLRLTEYKGVPSAPTEVVTTRLPEGLLISAAPKAKAENIADINAKYLIFMV